MTLPTHVSKIFITIVISLGRARVENSERDHQYIWAHVLYVLIHNIIIIRIIHNTQRFTLYYATLAAVYTASTYAAL